jgi:tetratricopeptide (TPR) repeat protein
LINSIEDISHWKTRIAVGRMAFDAGFYSQAARHFRMALALIREDSSSPELLSINLVCLAKALSCLGSYTEAEQLINEALQIDTASQDNLLQLARDYLELSSIYWKEHKAQLSEQYAYKTLELLSALNKKEKEKQVQSIARALKLLAIIKDEDNNYDEGLKLIDQALTLLEHSHQGTKSEAYGEALMVKVMLLIDKGEIEQVESMLDDAIQLIELHKGQFHPQLAKVMAMLAEHTKNTGRQDFASQLEKQAKGMQEKYRQI